MKISCTKENLNKGLQIVSHIATKNTTLPILNNVLLEAKDGIISLSATDLEIGVKSLVRGKVEKEGRFTVQAKLLADYVNLLSAERVNLEVKEKVLEITSETTQTKMNGQEAGEFPLLPKIEKKERQKVRIEDFRKAVQQTIFAVAQDESRPEISGVRLNFADKKLIVVTTDSYRLAEKKIDLLERSKKEEGLIVPAKTLHEVLRVLMDREGEMEIYLSENQIMFSLKEETEIISRLIEGQYPDYQQIIPQGSQTKVVVGRHDLIKVIKTASLFCKTGINDVNLDFLPDKKEIVVSATSSQLGENISRLTAEISGPKNNIIFNYRYLLDGLANIETEEVILEVVESGSPGLLKPREKEDYLYVIMPIKQ